MPRVVWAEESKNGIIFEIWPSYDVVPARSQLVTDGQSSCSPSGLLANLFFVYVSLIGNPDVSTTYSYLSNAIKLVADSVWSIRSVWLQYSLKSQQKLLLRWFASWCLVDPYPYVAIATRDLVKTNRINLNLNSVGCFGSGGFLMRGLSREERLLIRMNTHSS